MTSDVPIPGLAAPAGDVFDFAACTLTTWAGDRRRCRWCNTPLAPRRPRWCSRSCLHEWRVNHTWADARREALRRAGNRCSTPGCGAGRRLHVHHEPPCQGVRTISCAHHQERLRVHCETHHEREHAKAAA